ncbi:MAG TPA: pyridoxamine 5'-phosphate oxidase [Deltaproteobacteria bacterium]|nr:pyridoxamine 5'-phosphate oxidase [Deltaproteobacteria bacterium]
MTKDEILSFVNANPVCFLATADGDTPHVRAMGMYRADDRGILIQLSTVKGMYREITANPKVELCFSGGGKVVRVSGAAEFIEDRALKEEVVKARPFLKGLVDAQGLDVIKVFRVANPVASVWTVDTNLQPAQFVKL